MGRLSRVAYWLRLRGDGYVPLRMLTIFRRYGVTPAKGKRRALECVEFLGRYGCRPTFPTPGRLVGSSGAYFRRLQELGAELAVHGYDHVDFRSLTQAEAGEQFVRAAEAFSRNGIRFAGFRCPYLSCGDDLLEAIPRETFRYSSNRAIWWNVPGVDAAASPTAIFRALTSFYRAQEADETVSVPRMTAAGLVEIPASLPDDLQLYDGLRLGGEGVRRAWLEILHQTHLRGELFTTLFHPEAFDRVKFALAGVLEEARHLEPPVWTARLRDIEEWWREKSAFSAHVSDGAIRFDCSERATVLVRDVATTDPRHEWDGAYQVLDGRTLHTDTSTLPFLGLSAEVPADVAGFLREQGYIVSAGESPPRCSVSLDGEVVKRLRSEVELIEHVESQPGPLVRFWRWPDGARSALSATGDLDALSLVDYGLRLVRF